MTGWLGVQKALLLKKKKKKKKKKKNSKVSEPHNTHSCKVTAG